MVAGLIDLVVEPIAGRSADFRRRLSPRKCLPVCGAQPSAEADGSPQGGRIPSHQNSPRCFGK